MGESLCHGRLHELCADARVVSDGDADHLQRLAHGLGARGLAQPQRERGTDQRDVVRRQRHGLALDRGERNTANVRPVLISK